MKYWIYSLLIFIFSANILISQEKINHTSISFEGKKEFISSLKEILNEDFNSTDVQKALDPFNASSVGFRAATKEELFENLPLASNDLIISSRNLGLLESPETLVELQENVYVSAVDTIYSEFEKSFNLGAGLPIVAFLGRLGVNKDKKIESETSANVSMAASSATISETGDTSTITVSLSEALNDTINVVFGYSGTAAQGNDFSGSSTISIPAGETSATFIVTSIDDSIYEGDETSTITISSVDNSNVSISSSNSVTLTITEDETVPTLSLATSSATISENGGSSTITFALSGPINGVVSAILNYSNTATLGNDFSGSSTISIPAGETSATFTVTSIDDSIYEGDETSTITISSVDNSNVSISSSNSVTLTITEDETVPRVSLAASGNSIAEESGGGIIFTASIDQVASVDLTVTITTTVISRAYTANVPTSIDITIPAGSLTGTATFTPTDNDSFDGTSNVSFAISSVVGGGAVGNTVVIPPAGTAETVAVTETEAAPAVQLSASGSSVAENGSAITLTATLSGSTYEDVLIGLSGSGTATSGSDYSIANITIAAGTTAGTASFTPIEDSLYEGSDETAIISITGIAGGGVTTGTTTSQTITLSDSDSAPIVTLASSATSVTEGDSALTLTASLSVATTSNVTVTLDTSGTATEGSDYSAISDITISTGLTTGTSSFSNIDNSVYEGSETAIISIGSVSGGSASAASSGTSTTITLADDETAPQVNLSSSSSSVLEDGSAITVTATLSNVADEAVTIPLDASGTATEGTDYAAISDITISAGSATGTATITPIDDSVSEGAETLIVSLGTLSGADATAGSTSSLTLSLVDDDVPNITLTSSASLIAENGGSALTLTATASLTATEDIIVTLGTTGTATSGTDYTALPATLTIAAGATTATTSFTPTDDSVYDATSSETAIVSITNVSGGNALESGDQSVTLTITDNESAPKVQLSASDSVVAEDGSTITLTATLSGSTYEDVLIGLSGSGTATSGSDYSIANITIAAGTTAGTASFTPIEDSLYEGSDETAIISITGIAGGGVTTGTTTSQTITLSDSDSAPIVTLASSATSVTEGDSALTLTASLSVATTSNVTVTLDTSGTATEGSDYSAISDITISAGSTTGTSSFSNIDNSVYEGSETAIISIGSVSGGSASAASSGTSTTITLADDETAPQVNLSSSSSSVLEDGSAITVTATLSNVADEAVTIPLDASGTATEGTDYAAISDITISAGSATGTATITPIDDSVSEGAETLIVSLGTLSGADATAGSTSSLTLSLVDDDVPNITLTSSASLIAENGGSALTLTATASMTATEDIVVTLGTTGTATSGTDYTALPATLTIAAGATTATTSFTPTDDSVYDATSSETAIVSITNVSGGNALESGDQSVTLTITDNETAPTITLASGSSSVAEDGGTSTLTATLSNATYADVTVALGAAGTATSGTDYSYTSSITISAGSTTGTSVLTATADDIFDAASNETAIISVSTVSGGSATESGTQSETITITDAESAPTVTLAISDTTITEGASAETITATLSGKTYANVTVSISTSGTATEGSDYSAISDITISAGSTTGTSSFSNIDNSVYEGSETAIISIGSVSGGSASAASSGTSTTITLADDETAPQVNLSSSSSSVLEDGSAITVTATLSNVADEAVTIPLDASGTATEGTDYAAISDITISAGATTGTATITPTDDSVSEGAETLIVSLGTLSGADATAGSTSSLTISLVDDDVPNITLTSDASSIAENSGSSLTFTATASMTATEDIVVTLGTAGTATSGTDYTALPATLTIAAGATTATTSFTPSDDSLYDATSNETAIVSITNVSGGNALESGDQAVTLTIADNETAPTVTLASTSSSVAEDGGTSTLTATLSNATYADVTVALGAAGTATSGTDYSYTSSITISAGSTSGISVLTAKADDIFDAASNETAIISVSTVSGGGATESGTQSETITITDAESAPTVTLAISDTTITEGASAETITATLSGKTYANVTVSISTSGTATEGSDYSAISDITISTGSTTGTASFAITDDSAYEGSETATVSISSVSGGSASSAGSGTSFSVTLSDNETFLDDGNAPLTSAQETTASNYQASAEYQSVETGYLNKANEPNSFETANIHKAWAYGQLGAGQLVSVVDGDFWTTQTQSSATHGAFDGKTIMTFGTFSAPEPLENSHGTNVAGIVAAKLDGYGMIGVAPSANLHLVSNGTLGSYNYMGDKLAAAALDAYDNDAVAQNNSWGYTEQTITTMNVLITSYGYTKEFLLSNYLNRNTSTSAINAANAYVDALNDFQQKGVIVWAVSNCGNSSKYQASQLGYCPNNAANTDIDLPAGLPILFPQLKEGWIAVANVDYDGSNYELISAPCGQGAEFCMSADGQDMTVPGLVYGGASYSFTNGGSSYAAPQISGAIAILRNHFPNHTVEQIVDRLLASANNNIGFAYVNTVDFGNGVTHDYSYEAGHGMLDLYAALQPISGASQIDRVNVIGANGSTIYFALNETQLSSARSFGDALVSALDDELTYMYDALDGGFAFELDQTVSPSLLVSQPSISAASELWRTILTERLYENLTRKKERDPATDGYFEFSMTQSNQSLNNFASEGSWSGLNDTQYMFPFMSDVQGGTGLSFGNSIGDDYFSLSYTQQHEDLEEGDLKQAFTFSYGTEFGDSTDLEIIAGYVDEQEYFLGTKGSGAFDFSGADNNTSFMGFKSTSLLGDSLILNVGASLSYTDVNKPSSGIITGISDVTASAFELGVTKFGVLGGDALSFSVGQPHRVEDGNAHLQIAGLENSDGTVPYTYKSATLAPSGRQIDLSMAYNFDLSKKSAIRFKTMHMLEKGHVAGADPENSLFLGYASERIFGDDQFAMGAALTDANDTTVEMNYTIQW